MIIGFCGQKGSGKDTAGAYLVEKYGFERISFAQKLKESAAACWGIDPENWESLKNNPNAVVEIYDYSDAIPQQVASVTAREFLQRYGTEAHRQIFSDDFWVYWGLTGVTLDKNYVVTDVRFLNEVEAIKNNFHNHLIIQIVRDGSVKDAHASEAGLPESLIDGKIANNGSKEQLYIILDALMTGRVHEA